MSFEERMDLLAERNEALAQSVELLLSATRENTANIAKLAEVTNRDADAIHSLVFIAESHDRRIANSEGETAH
jgi:predicted transcriptional regulator